MGEASVSGFKPDPSAIAAEAWWAPFGSSGRTHLGYLEIPPAICTAMLWGASVLGRGLNPRVSNVDSLVSLAVETVFCIQTNPSFAWGE